MRLYFYISQAHELSHLSKILADAKRSNLRNDVTGLMSFNKGRYLQIIEGSNGIMSELISNISSDDRHHGINTILDIETSHRYFGDWTMKLVPLLARNKSFEIFMKIMAPKLRVMPESKQELVKLFHESATVVDKLETEFEWESKTFTVSQWPDFSEVIPSQHLLALCGALLNNKMSYNEIYEREYCRSDVELKEALADLLRVNCLVVSSASNGYVEVESASFDDDFTYDHSRLTLINKMKNFISAHLH